MNNLIDVLNSINSNKPAVEDLSGYSSFLVGRCMSNNYDTAIIANELNIRANVITADAHYEFLRLTVPKRRRYKDWKKSKGDKNITLIKKYYNCNTDRAKEALEILTQNEIAVIKKKLDGKGGRRR